MSQKDKNNMDHDFDTTLFDPIEPIRLFDDYFFVGNKLVGFHILKTSEGLVLFDSMDKTTADEEFLIPGLVKLGLENEPVRMLFLTHGHFDHYMGADAVRLRTGCDLALSREDCAYLSWADENRGPDKETALPHITRLVSDREEISFGDHTVTVIEAPGHTPGCLNYSFEVHDHGELHRVIMVGGYGVFGPGKYPGKPYPYGLQWAVDQALLFAGSMVKTWEYCKKNGCDVYLNPHPHLCDMEKLAEKNRTRKEGDLNAFVIGSEGVRKWIAERFDVCMSAVTDFSDIRRKFTE